MEVQKEEILYPKPRVMAKSSALFSFKNCPDEKMISRKIEISEIDAKWWIEVSKCLNSSDYKSCIYRIVKIWLDFKSSIFSNSGRNYRAKFDMSFNNDSSKKKNIEIKLVENDDQYEKIAFLIYYDQQNNIQNESVIKVLDGFVGIDLQIDGQLEISCDTIIGIKSVSSLLRGIGELLDTGNFSDFKLIVSGKEFKVHKNILSIASPVFSTMFECDLDEKKLNFAAIESNPETFQHFLEFLYTRKLPDNIDTVAIDLYEMAHRYQVDQLVEICEGHLLAKKIDKGNALRLYEFAITFEMKDLFDRAWDFIKLEILKIVRPINRGPFTVEEIRAYLREMERHEQEISKFFESPN